MSICTLDVMRNHAGAVAKVESAFPQTAFEDISTWLSDFYRREGKILDKAGYDMPTETNRWRHAVKESERKVSQVSLQYLGEEEMDAMGRHIKLQKFNVYFDFSYQNPNVGDRNSFKRYFDEHVLDQGHSLHRRPA